MTTELQAITAVNRIALYRDLQEREVETWTDLTMALIEEARQEGAGWAEIAEAMGMTRQGVRYFVKRNEKEEA